MKYEKVEKWTDVAMLVMSIVLTVMCATTGSYSEMLAWACVAMLVCIAAMRRNVRDRLYRLCLRAIGAEDDAIPKEDEVAKC